MNPIIISICDVNKDVEIAMITTLDLFEQLETNDDRSQFELKPRRIDLGSVSKEIIEKFKKELKS